MTRYIKLFITILVVISIITHVTVVDAKKHPKIPKKTIDEKMDVKKDMEKKAGKAGKECFEDTSKNEAQKKKCSLDKTKEEMKKLKGENVTDTEAEEMLLQAGKDRAAAVIKNCTRDASNTNAKKSCFTDSLTAAKEACKEYNGGDDCSNTEIMEGIKDLTVKDVQDKVSSCTKTKTTKAEKENCRKNKQTELKKDIADSLGKSKENIKDSEVQEVIKKGATKAIMNTIGLCNSTDVVDRKRCAKDGKQAMADSLGKDKDDISDYEFERFVEKGKKSKVASAMQACVKLAGSDKQKLKKCKDEESKKAMKENSVDGKEPSDTEVKDFLKEVSKEALKDVRNSCEDSKSVCDALAKKTIAESLGKEESEVTKLEFKEIERKAGVSAALENARDCYKARKDNASATCKDPFEAFQKVQGKTASADEKKKKTAEEKVKKAALIDAAAESRKLCLKKETKNEKTACLNEAKADQEEVAKILNPGEDSTKREKKQKAVEREANVEVLGNVFGECMKVAGSDKTKKKVCKDKLKENQNDLGDTEDADTIIRLSQANVLLEPAEACDGDDIKTCRQEAKAKAIELGLPEKEFMQTKKRAEVKGSAETWAACSEGGSTDAECDELGKEKFVEISGSDAKAYDEKFTPSAKQTVKERVRKMGKAIKDGAITKFYEKKKVVVTIETSGSTCNDNVKAEFKNKIKEVSQDASASAQLKKLDGVAEPNCRVVDAKAEYNTDVDTKDLTTKEDYDTVTSEIGTALSGLSYKTSRRRRLLGDVSTTSTYAAQDVTECAEDDTECQNDNAIEEDPAGSKKKVGEETSDGLSNSSRAVSLVSGWLLILLIGFIL